MSRRRIAIGVATSLYDRMLIAGSQLLLVPLLARGWGVGLYGCWVMLTTVPSFLAIADLGVGSAAYVRMTTLVARGERDAAVVTLHTAVRWQARTSLVVMSLALAAAFAVPATWLPHDPALPAASARAVLALLVGYTLLVLASGLLIWTLRSVELYAPSIVIGAHVALGEAVAVGAVAVAGGGLVAAAAAMTVARGVGVLALYGLLRRRAPWLRFGWARADAAEGRALARPALGALFIPLGQALVLQGSVAVLGAVVGPAATPAFTATRTLSRVALQGTQLLTHPLMPEFTAAAARGERRRQARMLLTLFAISVLGAVPLAMVLWIAGPAVVGWWSAGTIHAAPGLMRAAAGSVLLAGAWTPLSNLMLATNRQGAFSMAYAALGIGSLVVTGWLARSMGATGAGLGALALDGAMVIVVGRFVGREWARTLPLREALSGVGRYVARWR